MCGVVCVVVVAEARVVDAQLPRLEPQFGHNIGLQEAISIRSAWALSIAHHTARGRRGTDLTDMGNARKMVQTDVSVIVQ